MAIGLWSSLESLADGLQPAAVLAEWGRLANGDFPTVQPFLRVTTRLATLYPCVSERDCGCLHEVEPEYLFSRCECGGCEPVQLAPTDLIIHELDALRFGGAVARILGFEPAENAAILHAAPKCWPVGIYTPTRSPVYLAVCASEGQLLANLEGLASSRREPFIVLAPTANLRSEIIGDWLERQRCAFIPLARYIAGDGPGRFRATSPIQPLLDRFAAGCVPHVQSLQPVLEGIRREIAAVHADRQDLLTAKTRLEQMQGEGLFGFVKKIDREARDLFFAILAAGDTAKASRALEMKDSTLRSKVAQWRKRGKPYLALAEFVRWRKSIKGQAGIDFAKRVASGAERDVDFPALISDVVEELEALDPEHWEEQCEGLAKALRKAVS